jgi:diadenosine tetraphosphate (Ap4A) HIT family hydrolase
MNDALPGVTEIHRVVGRCRANEYPAMVAKLRSGWVVMGERQVFPGYCLLLPDPVVDQLNALEVVQRVQFLADMALVGDAVLASTAAVRINYAIFGNAEPALHAHVIPRHATEPAETRTTHPWALDWSAAAAYSEALHGALKCRITAHLAPHIVSP